MVSPGWLAMHLNPSSHDGGHFSPFCDFLIPPPAAALVPPTDKLDEYEDVGMILRMILRPPCGVEKARCNPNSSSLLSLLLLPPLIFLVLLDFLTFLEYFLELLRLDFLTFLVRLVLFREIRRFERERFTLCVFAIYIYIRK